MQLLTSNNQNHADRKLHDMTQLWLDAQDARVLFSPCRSVNAEPSNGVWQAMQPPMIPDEEGQFICSLESVPPDDLSRTVLEELASRVDQLKTFREEKLGEMLQRLLRLWDRLSVPTVAYAPSQMAAHFPAFFVQVRERPLPDCSTLPALLAGGTRPDSGHTYW